MAGFLAGPCREKEKQEDLNEEEDSKTTTRNPLARSLVQRSTVSSGGNGERPLGSSHTLLIRYWTTAADWLKSGDHFQWQPPSTVTLHWSRIFGRTHQTGSLDARQTTMRLASEETPQQVAGKTMKREREREKINSRTYRSESTFQLFAIIQGNLFSDSISDCSNTRRVRRLQACAAKWCRLDTALSPYCGLCVHSTGGEQKKFQQFARCQNHFIAIQTGAHTSICIIIPLVLSPAHKQASVCGTFVLESKTPLEDFSLV